MRVHPPDAYRLAVTPPLSAAVLDRLAAQVLRTDLERPGFFVLDLGPGLEPRNFRALLLDVACSLDVAYRQGFGRGLQPVSVGRFDQQVTTEAHRDGGPDESLLLLGYEPTTVDSRLSLVDYTRLAHDHELTPAQFLERCNPMTRQPPPAPLADCTTAVADFPREHYRVALINNSLRPWEERATGMLGVLHQATIVQPDRSQPRWVNSLLLATVAADAPPRLSADALHGFLERAEASSS